MGQASRKKAERRAQREALDRSRPNLERLLRDHYDLLVHLGEAFDGGLSSAALPLAVSVRVLVHDTPQSTSLLSQLLVKDDLRFKDTAQHINPRNLLRTNFGLVIASMKSGTGGSWVAACQVPGQLPPGRLHPDAPFSSWWGTPVVRDKFARMWNRRQLVLDLANKEGGAHVDPLRLDELKKLEKENAMGMMFSDPLVGQDQPFLNGPLLPSVRQIGHELQETLEQAQADAAAKIGGLLRRTSL